MMQKILVLGYFGYNINQLDGQTVKTRDIYRLVKEQANELDVDYYDTEDFKYHKLSIFKMFWKVIRCSTLFYLPAHNNLKNIFPIIYVLSRIFRFNIHYFVVGGWLREFLTNLPIHRWMLKRISGIHVETRRLLNELKEYYQFDNVDIFPNFRFFDFDPQRSESQKLRLVFMARVNKIKGLDWIFPLADYIQENKLEDSFSLTFFGPINQEDTEYFNTNLSKYSFVEYKGAIQPSEIYETLSEYDVMLLPTHYYTEGLPGSVVDAYISGIPVIVTNWKHATEFVEDGISGFIIPFENGQQALIEKVLLLKQDRELLHQLQGNALKKRMEFAPPSLKQHLGGGEIIKLCFVSRVEESKGLDTIKEIVYSLYSLCVENQIIIDFYGQKKDHYYDSQLSNLGICKYKGILQPNEVVPVLKRYDALLFPTHYEGEGCPGILIEALSAGLPIIASDWKDNKEFVINGVNGFLCDTFDAEMYVYAITALFDPILKKKMKYHSYYLSQGFSSDKALLLINNYLNN